MLISPPIVTIGLRPATPQRVAGRHGPPPLHRLRLFRRPVQALVNDGKKSA